MNLDRWSFVYVEPVIERCGRCGWTSERLPLAEARAAFATHACSAVAAAPARTVQRRSSR